MKNDKKLGKQIDKPVDFSSLLLVVYRLANICYIIEQIVIHTASHIDELMLSKNPFIF